MPPRSEFLCAVLGAVLLIATACSDATSSSGGPTRFESAFAGLCRSLVQAGDVSAARATFFDRSHQALHELAAELETVDRAAAGRLLEAKARVEAALEQDSSDGMRRSALRDLVRATRAGLGELSVEVSCP